MTKSFLLAALVAIAPFATAQLAGLPSCAVNPAVGVLNSTECGLTDFECTCKDAQIFEDLAAVVQASCNDPNEISSGLAAASSICAPYGGIPSGVVTSTPGVAPTSGSVAAAADSTGTFSSATAPYAAGNTSTPYATTGSLGSANRTGAGSPIVTGAAVKDAAIPAIREAGLMAGLLAAVIGGAVML